MRGFSTHDDIDVYCSAKDRPVECMDAFSDPTVKDAVVAILCAGVVLLVTLSSLALCAGAALLRMTIPSS
jgi:hypothetical protein